MKTIDRAAWFISFARTQSAEMNIKIKRNDMTIKEIAKQKALKARCDGCGVVKTCAPEMSKACFDSYVKGFMVGYKHKASGSKAKEKKECRQCGRKYTMQESEAEMKEFFCCIACEYGY